MLCLPPLPSFLQCCTLPDRVIDYTEHALQTRGLRLEKKGSIRHYAGTLFAPSRHQLALEDSLQPPLISVKINQP